MRAKIIRWTELIALACLVAAATLCVILILEGDWVPTDQTTAVAAFGGLAVAGGAHLILTRNKLY